MAQVANRPRMEDIWMNVAENLASRSTCDRLSVGAVITSFEFERVYSVGYNGGARGQSNKCESKQAGMCGHLHAEINALIKCQVYDPAKVMFITHQPCRVCAKAIVNSGFAMVIYKHPYRDVSSIGILKQAYIDVIKISEI